MKNRLKTVPRNTAPMRQMNLLDADNVFITENTIYITFKFRIL